MRFPPRLARATALSILSFASVAGAQEPPPTPKPPDAPAPKDDDTAKKDDDTAKKDEAPVSSTGAEPSKRAEKAEPRPTAPSPPLPGVPEGDRTGRFQFGSYGRVMTSLDGKGGPGRDADIVSHGSRLDESTYVELELRREDDWTPDEKDHVRTLVVSTLAIGDPLFHYSGQFDAKIAVRNLYVEERGLFDPGLAFWVGSRMYRGDDAYLLDWWPMDNLNTVGGGVRYDLPTRTQIALHVGSNRLNDPFQYQTAARALPYDQLGTTDVAILDRPRVIESGRIEQIIPAGEKGGFKAVGYGELHELASGQRETEPGKYEQLAGEQGYVAGLQLGAFTGERDTHVNLFFRYAHGLAAYGELGVPYAVAIDKTTKTAHDFNVALTGNYEVGPLALQGAAYFRSFRTASSEQFNYLNFDEGAIVVRPNIYFHERAGVAFEGTYETIQRAVLDPSGDTTGLRGSMWRFGVIPFLSPSGKGSYKRPHLRAIFLWSKRDDGARAMYPADDVFARRSFEQFYGLEAEWWFNSSYRLARR